MHSFRIMAAHPEGELRSDHRPTELVTPKQPFEAKCTTDHAPPAVNCRCGVYVLEDPTPLVEWIMTGQPTRRLFEWLLVVEGDLLGPILPDPAMPFWDWDGDNQFPSWRGSAFVPSGLHAHRGNVNARAVAALHELPLHRLEVSTPSMFYP